MDLFFWTSREDLESPGSIVLSLSKMFSMKPPVEEVIEETSWITRTSDPGYPSPLDLVQGTSFTLVA